MLHYDRSSGKHALFDLSRDPGEHIDIAGDDEATAERLRKRLLDFIVAGKDGANRWGWGGAGSPLTADEVEHLRSLGYLE